MIGSIETFGTEEPNLEDVLDRFKGVYKNSAWTW